MKEDTSIKGCAQAQQLMFTATLKVGRTVVPVNISVNKSGQNLIELSLTPCPHAINRHAHSLFPIAELHCNSGAKLAALLVQGESALKILLSATLS